MTGQNIKIDSKKIYRSNFYKNKKLFNIYDIDVSKILISEKETYRKKKAHSSTLMAIIMMMSLVHYV